jgi:hypothetical protein
MSSMLEAKQKQSSLSKGERTALQVLLSYHLLGLGFFFAPNAGQLGREVVERVGYTKEMAMLGDNRDVGFAIGSKLEKKNLAFMFWDDSSRFGSENKFRLTEKGVERAYGVISEDVSLRNLSLNQRKVLTFLKNPNFKKPSRKELEEERAEAGFELSEDFEIGLGARVAEVLDLPEESAKHLLNSLERRGLAKLRSANGFVEDGELTPPGDILAERAIRSMLKKSDFSKIIEK